MPPRLRPVSWYIGTRKVDLEEKWRAAGVGPRMYWLPEPYLGEQGIVALWSTPMM